MGRKLTTEQYGEQLAVSRPHISVIDTYLNLNTEINHKCCFHGNFRATPNKVLYDTHTGGCRGCSLGLRRTPEEYRKELKKETKGKIEVLDDFIDINTEIRYFCNEHLCEFTNTPAKKQSCPQCKKDIKGKSKIIPIDAFKERLSLVDTHIRYSSGYTKLNTKCLFTCTIHKFTWPALPGNILAGHYCPLCKSDANVSNRFKSKTYKLGRKLISIQGYENFALDHLLKRYRPLDIHAGKGASIPAFKYLFKGTERWHFPDIYVESNKTIYEVKSTFTLGLNRRTKGYYAQMKAKAKTAHNLGYKYRILVVLTSGKVITLPKIWYNLPKPYIKDLCKYFN